MPDRSPAATLPSAPPAAPSGSAQLPQWVLTVVCEDRPGIVHALSGAIVAADGNILESQQFSSPDTGRFFLRQQIEIGADAELLREKLAPIAQRFAMELQLEEAGRPRRVLVLASTAEHCVRDLLFHQRAGQLPVEIPLVMANHDTLRELVEFHRVPFESHPVKGAEQKAEFEARVLEAIEEHDIELVILARYMQILSPELCEALSGRCINIHHSFLPGFKGANPYRQAHERGVKLIGATAHFVTSDLDEGPIIEQNVTRVDHAHSVAQLREIGQDQEALTLRRAVTWAAQSRVLLDGTRTVVFR
ncbi:formyltetrahydrofolate deformylase [Brachybacterium sp. JHP9]|uniref:Formyltetrahydrofolate deformylase n=1 Tax=Brachybacterium equifaecis TaxID=2910770 RepID=A0ABT0R0B3_9MICO|nr:formyltetrahydrofolate deformylase [Brachybacterium equifaecis]MCL6423359.1 formyltetrahydrofolate deformylase [Brachybacterium equifaecis]